MKVQQFLGHYGIDQNPFGQEDAQTDQVFKRHCLDGTYHPAWDKILGSPGDPSTAVVFGEKGSGKTALRLQIVEHIRRHNVEHPEQKVAVIEYDNFNPYLDCFRDRLLAWNKQPERCLQHWRLWDHMDAILALGVTQLINAIADEKALNPAPEGSSRKVENGSSFSLNIPAERVAQLPRTSARDLLLLAAIYDNSRAMAKKYRWSQLRKKLRFSTWKAEWDRGLGIAGTLLLLGLLLYTNSLNQLGTWWPWVVLVGLWWPWMWRHGMLLWQGWRVARQVRVIDHHPNRYRQLLSRFERSDLADQPVPSKERSDDRYELLSKYQELLKELGYQGVTVLMDRVDEPELINGNPERMRDFVWPMFDNKFLKHPGMGFKMLLPIEISFFLNREDKEFFERSRLDKQNLIRSLVWTGESLYDVANDRLRACASDPKNKPTFRDFFDESISDAELISTLARLRVPRHLFKFAYRLLVDHCNCYTDDQPRWKISRETLHATLALYLRDLQEFDRGMGTG